MCLALLEIVGRRLVREFPGKTVAEVYNLLRHYSSSAAEGEAAPLSPMAEPGGATAAEIAATAAEYAAGTGQFHLPGRVTGDWLGSGATAADLATVAGVHVWALRNLLNEPQGAQRVCNLLDANQGALRNFLEANGTEANGTQRVHVIQPLLVSKFAAVLDEWFGRRYRNADALKILLEHLGTNSQAGAVIEQCEFRRCFHKYHAGYVAKSTRIPHPLRVPLTSNRTSNMGTRSAFNVQLYF